MPDQSGAQLNTVLENRGIKFHIRTGGAKWACIIQDRASYERRKATRSNSTDSVASTLSNASTSSARSH